MTQILFKWEAGPPLVLVQHNTHALHLRDRSGNEGQGRGQLEILHHLAAKWVPGIDRREWERALNLPSDPAIETGSSPHALLALPRIAWGFCPSSHLRPSQAVHAFPSACCACSSLCPYRSYSAPRPGHRQAASGQALAPGDRAIPKLKTKLDVM